MIDLGLETESGVSGAEDVDWKRGQGVGDVDLGSVPTFDRFLCLGVGTLVDEDRATGVGRGRVTFMRGGTFLRNGSLEALGGTMSAELGPGNVLEPR